VTPKEFIAWREALGGRRFLLTLGSGLVNTGLVIASRISEDIFQNLILGTVGAYILGATYQTVKNHAVDNPAPVAPAVPVYSASTVVNSSGVQPPDGQNP